MNTPVNSTDPMHSMEQMAKAAALLKTARELIAEAYREVKHEWEWHRPDDNWKVPADIEEDAQKAASATQNFNAAVHWTMNTLRKEAKPSNDQADASRL